MQFHELFLEVRTSEVKDLEYCELLSHIREHYEKLLASGQNNPTAQKIIHRVENMSFTVNMNDFVGLMNVNQEARNFDYACEFNPSQKSAINLLLSVISAPQKGEYIKGFFALYVWKNLLPDVRFHSVGLTDSFYEIAEITNSQGDYEFKPASDIKALVQEEKETAFFKINEEEHCHEAKALIAEIDKAVTFILKKYV